MPSTAESLRGVQGGRWELRRDSVDKPFLDNKGLTSFFSLFFGLFYIVRSWKVVTMLALARLAFLKVGRVKLGVILVWKLRGSHSEMESEHAQCGS